MIASLCPHHEIPLHGHPRLGGAAGMVALVGYWRTRQRLSSEIDARLADGTEAERHF